MAQNINITPAWVITNTEQKVLKFAIEYYRPRPSVSNIIHIRRDFLVHVSLISRIMHYLL